MKWATLQIGAKLGWFVIVDTRPTQADISHKIVSSPNPHASGWCRGFSVSRVQKFEYARNYVYFELQHVTVTSARPWFESNLKPGGEHLTGTALRVFGSLIASERILHIDSVTKFWASVYFPQDVMLAGAEPAEGSDGWPITSMQFHSGHILKVSPFQAIELKIFNYNFLNFLYYLFRTVDKSDIYNGNAKL